MQWTGSLRMTGAVFHSLPRTAQQIHVCVGVGRGFSHDFEIEHPSLLFMLPLHLICINLNMGRSVSKPKLPSNTWVFVDYMDYRSQDIVLQ